MKDDSASRQEFDEVAARHRQAEATLAQTTAMRDAADQRIQQAEAAIGRGPGGQKGRRHTCALRWDGLGQNGGRGGSGIPGNAVSDQLEKAGAFSVDLLLPEQHIQSIRRDQKVEISIPGLRAAKASGGRIDRIVPAADQKSRSFLVKVALPEDADVRSGMFARVSVPVGEAGMILIPGHGHCPSGPVDGCLSGGRKQYRTVPADSHRSGRRRCHRGGVRRKGWGSVCGDANDETGERFTGGGRLMSVKTGSRRKDCRFFSSTPS